ncbi:MAG: PAS domain S-box protein [Planctomycetota bacterium]
MRTERAARQVQEQRVAELERLAARNAAILQNAMDGFFVLGQDYRFQEVNDAFCRMTGYTTAELQTMKMTDLEVAAPPGAGAPQLRTGLHHFATAHRHKDGHTIQLESCVIVLRDGTERKLVGFTRDVTERHRAELALRASETKYRNLVESSRDLIWALDAAGNWTFANAAARAIYGCDPDELIGRSVLDFVRPERRAHARQALEQLRAGGARQRFDTEHVRKDGRTVYLTVDILPVLDERGHVTGFTGTSIDITYRKEAEAERERLEGQLRQSQKLESLGVLAGGVAHDFNNLLVGILGNASLALEQVPPIAPVRRLLERVVRAGRRATELTQRMLAYAGRASCDVKPMDLGPLIREMADFAAAGVPKNVALQVETADNLPLINADSSQVQQIIMNLLINAAEAIGERGGTVQVRTSVECLDAARISAEYAQFDLAPGPHVLMEVRDDGCGMPPETLSRIFDPFFTTKFKGRGLGLSAILGIVRAHHGAITVASAAGVGTTFRVLFPATDGRPAPVTGERHVPILRRGATVLVIDDEEEIRDVVEAVLASRGLTVLCAADGQRGLALFRAHRDAIDAVLLDMNMPGMSGEEVFAALRAEKPDVRVIVSTGYSEQEAALHFADAPLAGFVHKPYTASALVEKIGTAIAAVR